MSKTYGTPHNGKGKLCIAMRATKKTNIVYKYTRNSIPLHFPVFPYINPSERSKNCRCSLLPCGHFCHTFTRPFSTSLPIKLTACCQRCVWARTFSTELASTVSPCSCCLCLGSWQPKNLLNEVQLKGDVEKSVCYQWNIVDDSEIQPSPGMYKNTVESK